MLIMIEYDGVDDSSSCSSDFDRKLYLRLYTIATPLTSMLRTSSLTVSSTSVVCSQVR